MKKLNTFAWIVLINIYLVVIAGSVVRMSGAGMGCPDWPKCFGYLIPPTNENQITWGENKTFDKGNMIMKDSALFVAANNFTTTSNFNTNNWEKYTKHDYAKFNKYHTWTEWFNRLFGALLGFTSLLLLYFSIKKWKTNKAFTYLTIIQILLIGFEAWLGKLTVDSHLDPSVITYHMLGVVVMIWIQLVLLKKIKQNTDNTITLKKPIYKYLALAGIILMIAQTIIGSQVRQQTDIYLDAGISRDILAENYTAIFYFHRSFSILLVGIVMLLFYKLWNIEKLKYILKLLVFTVILEVLAGMFLFYLGMKSFGQPIHLFLSLFMYGVFVALFLKMNSTKKYDFYKKTLN
jgi:cytochrome c oxidase assembly protein subunit 15